MKVYPFLKESRLGFTLPLVFALVISGCVMMPEASAPSPESTAAAEPEEAMAEETMAEEEKDEGKPHWSYTGEEGPEFWGGISPDFALCGSGVEQSPIDLADASDADLSDIVFNYGESDLIVLNNGHTIQANYDSGSSIELDGESFNLLQFHLHAMSEHTLNGEFFPLELHLVHQAESGQLAVVGLMIQEGDANEALASMWENLPAEANGPTTIEGASINVADLLPADQSTFRYMGSLTTPPCSEQVRWHVVTEPITMSAEQIAAFTDIYDNNNRPVQAINERELVLDEATN